MKHKVTKMIGAGGAALAVAMAGAMPADASVLIDRSYGATYYDSSRNMLWVEDQSCNSAPVYAQYHWAGVSDNVKSVWDYHCYRTDGPVTAFLSPPSSATGIYVRLCQSDWGWDTCSSWYRTAK